MIRRLYIDGYKAFVNHTIEFDRLVFLAGGNGTGKSGHFDVVWAIRELVCEGKDAKQAFPFAAFTQFQRQVNDFNGITLEIDYAQGAGTYRYRLVLVQDEDGDAAILSEALSLNGESLYRYEDGWATIPSSKGEPVKAPLEFARSGLSLFPWERIDARTGSFVSLLGAVQNVQFNAFAVEDSSSPAEAALSRDGRNLGRWLAGRMQDYETAHALVETWRRSFGIPINPRFDAFGHKGRMTLDLRYGSQTQTALLSDLSEGQRALIELGALLTLAKRDGGVLLLDEPDNFLSYREVQALISDVQEASLTEGAQILLVSHNPSLMRSLGGVYGYRFYRDPENGHVRYVDLAKESEGVYADLVVLEEEVPA